MEATLQIEQTREQLAEKLDEAIRKNMDLQNKLAAARLQIITMENLIDLIEIDGLNITANVEVIKELKREQEDIPKRRTRRYKKQLPYEHKSLPMDAWGGNFGKCQCHGDGT